MPVNPAILVYTRSPFEFGVTVIFLRILTVMVLLVASPTWLNSSPNSVPSRPNTTDQFLKRQWTTEDGLPQSTVTSMVQTRDGYMWLGTFGGLTRFDGIRFTTFNTANTPSLHSNRITALHEDRDGVLWIGEENGGVIRYAGGKFEVFLLAEDDPTDLVSWIHRDRNGGLWVTNSNSVKRYEVGKPRSPATFRLPKTASTIAEGRAGDLWFGVRGGLTHWQDGQVTDYVVPHTRLAGFDNFIRIDSADRIWLITEDGIDLFENGKYRRLLDLQVTADRQLARMSIDSSDHAWLGYFENVYRISADGSTEKFGIGELSSNGIRSMLFDNEGNLWVGTNGDGLIRLRSRQVQTLSTANGLPNDEITSIVEDPVAGVWIGATGLTHWQNGRATSYFKRDGLPGDLVTALAFDHKGVLWIGTFVGLASLENGKITSHPDPNGLRQLVKCIYEDRKGDLWVGRRNGGLQLYKDGKFKTFTRSDGLVHDDVRYITEDRAGNLWIGTVGGMSRLKDGVFKNYTSKDGLSNDFVREIFEDAEGTFWIGTYGGGINRFRDDKFISITMKDGLFDDFVSRILPDDRGKFWVLGNRGIFSVSRQVLNDFADGRVPSVISSSYGVVDGLLSSEGNGGNQPAGWAMKDGRLWFPMIRGVAIIDPHMTSAKPPPVLIEEVTLDRRPLGLHDRVTINPAQENLEIRYTGLSFTKPEQIKFRYKLEGLDKDWVIADTRRVAYFPHLPPGNYKFVVSAANADGVWNEQTASLEIVVFPPFWQRWYFIAVAVLVVVGLLALIFQLRLNQLKRRRAVQEEFSRRLIDGHEAERRRVAAELHDGLGQDLLIIKNWAALGLAQAVGDAPVREQLEEISTTAGRALNETRTMVRNLRPFHLERFGLCKSLQYMSEQIEAASGIEIETEIETIDGQFPPEAEISIYRIVQESLNNIVKHSGARHAWIVVSRSEGAVTISIRDDGSGFVSDQELKPGFGMMGMAERVNLLGGKFDVETERGQGTRLTATLPLTKAGK